MPAETSDSAVADDVVTVYQAQCVPMEYEFWECARKGGRLYPSGMRNFLVSIEKQTVFEEQEFFGPYEYVDCNVMDDDNWSCMCDDDEFLRDRDEEGQVLRLSYRPACKRAARRLQKVPGNWPGIVVGVAPAHDRHRPTALEGARKEPNLDHRRFMQKLVCACVVAP